MYRTLVILGYTFLDAITQPIFSLLISLGAILVIFGLLPFFTLGEDTKMFKSVGLDVVLILVLLSTLFATSKCIYEEIEDRTMLTLMSKPVQRWEVMVGKYLGIVLSSALGVAILGLIMVLCIWMRVPSDLYLASNSLDDRVHSLLMETREMHIAGLLPQLVLTWLQISVLAAVSVALSTRFSLVVNIPCVILLYLAGNLTRFLFPISNGPLSDKSGVVKGMAWVASLVLPYLATFDLKNLSLLSTIKLAGTQFANDPHGVYLSTLWYYVAIAALNAVAYSAFALSLGMWSFQTRELGGAEG